MPLPKITIGGRFTRLLVKVRGEKVSEHDREYHCLCDCGNKPTIRGSHLTFGKTESCGCLAREVTAAFIIKAAAARAARKIALDKTQAARLAKDLAQGKARSTKSTSTSHKTAGYESPTHISWKKMRERCTDPKCLQFSRYGGAARPVTVCKRWLDSKHGFKNFLSDMGERIPGTSIGRFGDAGPYTKNNCARQTQAEQSLERELKNESRNPDLFARKMNQFRKNHYNLMFALAVNKDNVLAAAA
jgi:hypothetical protein